MSGRFDADIELFAALEAELDDPFAARAAVLSAAALTEETSGALAERWRARLIEPANALAERYADAYARARAARIEARRRAGGAATGSAPLPLGDAASALASETVAPRARATGDASIDPGIAAPHATESGHDAHDAERESDAAERPPPEPPAAPVVMKTADLGDLVPRRALPFEPRAENPLPTSTFAPAPAAMSAREAPARIDFATADISDAVPRAAMPFTPPPSAAGSNAQARPPETGAGPPRRWMRFDPQTGKPLPEPRWVDVLEDAGDPVRGETR